MTVALISLLAGIEMIGSGSAVLIAALLIFALILFIALMRVETHTSEPIIPSSLFHNRPLVIDFILFALIWGAFIGFLIYSPMWAQGILGTSALIGGATQIPGSLTDLIGSNSVAPIRRHLTPQRVVALGIVALTMTFVMMLLFGINTPYWVILIAAAFEGMGNGICFNELQVKVQQDADPNDVPIATSFSFLIRMLSQTLTAAIFGIIMNNALRKGVAQAGGSITMKMMNKLSDATNISSLPSKLLPQMRQILYNGLHNIMVVALVLMLLSLGLNLWAQKLEREKYARLRKIKAGQQQVQS